MTDRPVADLRAWGLERHPHLSEPELMLVIDVAVTVLGPAVQYRQVDRPAAERIAAVHTMLNRGGAGLAVPEG